MRIYQPNYRDKKTGRTRKQRKYWVEFRDHKGCKRRLPACARRQQAEAFGRQVQALLDCQLSGDRLDDTLLAWLEGLPESVVRRLTEWDVIGTGRSSLAQPLAEHVQDFRDSLAGKDRTPQYVRETVRAVRQICQACGFLYWRHVEALSVERYVAELRQQRELSARTYNQKLKAFKQFCAWMVRQRRASESLVRHLQALNVKTDRRRVRRALQVDEARKLLTVTRQAKQRYGMLGSERALLYRLALETGLRAGELRSLTVGSFDLEQGTVTVLATASKRRRNDVLPLLSGMIGELRRHLAGRDLADRAFAMPHRDRVAKMLRADLAEAQIPYRNEAGRYMDFHSFRHTTGTWLAQYGVHPKVAQSIMRHSDINLTMNTYTHVLRESERTALQSLPDLSMENKPGASVPGADRQSA